MPEFSIVIPVYNSEKTISPLIEEIENQLAMYDFEVILVNDGSKDRSHESCLKLAKENKNITYINLRKNFGEFNAVMCGLNYISGQYAIMIDDDFQNPPSEILKLVNKAKEGDFDVVYSKYLSKKHNSFRNFGSKLVNYLTTFLLRKPKDLYLSSFKLLKKELVDEIIKYKGPKPYIDGILFQLTDNIGTQVVEHKERSNGASNYSIRRLISLFMTILFGYSMIPLRLIMFTGIFSIFFALCYMLLYATNVIGEWGSPIVIFMCGVLLCSLALVGEYIGNTFFYSGIKPQFVVKSVHKKD
jgi:glycosyltransferase involved in cell wall biosynthesis